MNKDSGSHKNKKSQKNSLLIQKKHETFQRIKVDTVVSLILQTEQIRLEEELVFKAVAQAKHGEVDQGYEDANNTSCAGLEFQKHMREQGVKGVQSQRASYLSVISGYGEYDFKKSGDDDNKRVEEANPRNKLIGPCLLLDVRSAEEYKTFRIITARNYPSFLLARANTVETPEMLALKNVTGKLIIFYDLNESDMESVRAVETLVQRGYDNAVLMSGGIQRAYRKYPKGLVCGKIPQNLSQTSDEDERKKSVGIIDDTPLKDEFDDGDLCALREGMHNNILPMYSKSRLYKPTTSSRTKADGNSRRWK